MNRLHSKNRLVVSNFTAENEQQMALRQSPSCFGGYSWEFGKESYFEMKTNEKKSCPSC